MGLWRSRAKLSAFAAATRDRSAPRIGANVGCTSEPVKNGRPRHLLVQLRGKLFAEGDEGFFGQIQTAVAPVYHAPMALQLPFSERQ